MAKAKRRAHSKRTQAASQVKEKLPTSIDGGAAHTPGPWTYEKNSGAFIVTAVNSHAALLAACKALLHDATTPKVKGSEVDSFARIRNVEMACEAIAAAEGKVQP